LETRREEAHAALTEINGNIQRFLVASNTPTLTQTDLSSLYPNLPMLSKNGYYNIAIGIGETNYCASSTTPNYTITARAYGTQTDDTNCYKIFLDSLGNKCSYKYVSNTESLSTECW
jgi:Tfp pilus assembly protein PilE